jgi:hypothetical protein
MAKLLIFNLKGKAVEDVLSPDREAADRAFNACAFRILKEPDIDRIVEGVESCCEVDPKGGPPVLVVNGEGARVITSTFGKPLFWSGFTVWDENADSLLSALIRICHCYPKAHANLGKLVDDFKQALLLTNGLGVAVVSSDSADDIRGTKCTMRGHLIQRRFKKEARLRGRDFGWYEDLGDRPEAKLFAVAMQRCSLQEQADRTTVVSDFAMEINNGQWRKHSITADAAKVWITAYFREVQRMLGRESLLKFRPILKGRLAKAAFREAEVCPNKFTHFLNHEKEHNPTLPAA